MPDMPDPSTLSDEELDRLIAGEEPEEAPETPSAPVEPEQPEAVVEPEEPEASEEPVEAEEPESEPKPPSRREQLRLQQLLDRYKTAPPAAPAAPTPKGLNYEEELEADPDTVKRLEEDRTTVSRQAYNDGLAQAQNIQWNTLLQIDQPAVESSFPQLNPKNAEQFHPAVANAINTYYLHLSGYDQDSGMATNPGVRYTEFVESIYELAEEIAATKVQKTQKNIARQATQTGLRPNGTQAKKLNLNQAPEDMSDEELDAYLSAQGL